MNTPKLFHTKNSRGAWIVFLVCILLSLAAFVTASQVQRDFGRVEVSNATYPNSNGIPIRAKLLKPVGVSPAAPAPGLVYIHGQNNRETSNAYCIVLCDDPSPGLARRYGPLIETEAYFPNRTNVQFMQVLDRSNIRIEIWERGAGYTLASGSSSTAAAATAYKLGLCDAEITVHMPGGKLKISLAPDFSAKLQGPVNRICSGIIESEMFEESQEMF